MNINLNSHTVRTHPAFASPMRIGVLAHLAAFASGKETQEGDVPLRPYCLLLSPGALAATISVSRSQLENAIADLAKHDMLRVDKTIGKRGQWFIDLSLSASMFANESSTMTTPKEVPTKHLMDRWDVLYEKKNGYKYIRSSSDYWREKSDWNKLYQSLGEETVQAMEKYFTDIRFSQWGYAFKVFFKSAPRLSQEQIRRGWEVK